MFTMEPWAGRAGVANAIELQETVNTRVKIQWGSMSVTSKEVSVGLWRLIGSLVSHSHLSIERNRI